MQILIAPPAFLQALASAAFNSNPSPHMNANLSLWFATSQQISAKGAFPWNTPYATGAAAASYINAGSQLITGMPTPVGVVGTPLTSARSWRLDVFPSGAMANALKVSLPFSLNEECAANFANPADWLQLGFVPYFPTSGAPLSTV